MRGEVLSSVELVLPPTVVETCYSIKRDVQARFRAVNSEEKTKSEITVEKQTDDSVRIHVLVISLNCLTDEEIYQETAYDIPDKENTEEPIKNGANGPQKRAKGRRGLTKRLKAANQKKPLNTRLNEEAFEEKLSDSAAVYTEIELKANELDHVHSETDGKERESVVGQQKLDNAFEESPKNTDSQKTLAKKQQRKIVRRGRKFSGRRNVRKAGLAVENCTEKDDSEIAQDKVLNSDDKPIDIENKTSSTNSADVPYENSTGGISDPQVEDTSVNCEIHSPKGRAKRARKNDPNSADKVQSTKISVSNRTRGKLLKPELEESNNHLKEEINLSSSRGNRRRKASQTLSESDTSTRGPSGPTDQGTVIARKRQLPTKGAENNLTEKNSFTEEHTVSLNDDKCQEDVNRSDKIGSREEKQGNTEQQALEKGATRAKLPNPTSQTAEDNTCHKSHDDDVSVQGKAVEVDSPQDSNKGLETVKLPPKGGRRRGRPVGATSRQSVVASGDQPVKPTVVSTETSLPQPPRRVKTKAQLKQKPSELLDSDHDVESSSVNKPSQNSNFSDGGELQTGPSQRQVVKKPAQKPKTLARIWRTRKKSGFTHRKKSRPKTSQEGVPKAALSDSVAPEPACEDPEKEIIKNAHEESSKEGAKRANDVLPAISSALVNREEAAAAPDKDGSNTTDFSAVPDGTVIEARTDDNLKLPQKKRHTAKLAAERQKAAEQANTASRSSEAGRVVHAIPETQFDGLAHACTDFNETSAIESLIQLSNATDESFHVPLPRPTPSAEDQALPSQEGVPGASSTRVATLEPSLLSEDLGGEVKAAVESISTSGGESKAKDNLQEIPAPSATDALDQLLQIADSRNEKRQQEQVQQRPQQRERRQERQEQQASERQQNQQQNQQQNLSNGRQVKRAYKREFKVQCRFCQVKVKDYGYLFRHVKKLHRDKGTDMQLYLEEIRPLMRTPCPICNKMVSSISNISSHIKQCHATKDSAVICSICKKTYKTTVSLRQHLRQCHQPQQHRFFCHLCSANFTEKRSLKEHINCSHETTQVFHCDECGKSFLTKGRLRRHKYIHGEFRHKCGYCGKGFHLKDNMNKHIEIVHEKTQGKRFECPHCDKKFTVKGNMTQHVMGVHLKQFQYTCPQCQTGFRRKKDMLSHMLKHGDMHSNASGSAAGSVAPSADSSFNGDQNSINDGEGGSSKEGSQVEDLWHGRGEKTEVITGLTSSNGSKDGNQGLPRKTEVIVISPVSNYTAAQSRPML